MDKILKILEKNSFKVSTDTRKDLTGSVYFALKGESFDGNNFVHEAIKKGAVAAITDNPKNVGKNIYLVHDTHITLSEVAKAYRKKFKIPIITIGGSNGKTTSKELVTTVLKTKYKIHATEGNFNNRFGLPLSILSMPKKTKIGIFEIGANHAGEHVNLLEILAPTHVVITNNGMDHLEGFGSPSGVRKANKEIYDWAKKNKAVAFVDKNQRDLMEDSKKIKRILYPLEKLDIVKSTPLSISYKKKTYKTNLVGEYNKDNIDLALSIGDYFNIKIPNALLAICTYIPASKRSQFVKKKGVNFIVDCYNANPTSMVLSLDSFVKSIKKSRGVILGDMLELGRYSAKEHDKIAKYVIDQNLDSAIFIGKYFKQAIEKQKKSNYKLFPDSEKAKKWFSKQNFNGFTFLLKGSRGIRVEKIIGM